MARGSKDPSAARKQRSGRREGPASAAPDLEVPGSLAVSPSGRLYAASAGRWTAAFARGPGEGLLALALAPEPGALPPEIAFWRAFGREYLTRFCGTPEIEERRTRPAITAPPELLGRLADVAPPMVGAEYLTPEVLARSWEAVEAALVAALDAHSGSVESFFVAHGPEWHVLGRVCLHLAETKKEPPFAFLATFAGRAEAGRVKHQPLGEAVRSGGADRERLRSLLVPVQRAAERSAVVRELVEAGAIFRQCAWSAEQAHRFLCDVPVLEESGVVVRVPDWWRRRPRPVVSVRIGEVQSALGAAAMLDFSVELTLDGAPLTVAEREALLSASAGLAFVRGQWVEIDRQRLEQVLAHWREVERAAEGGVPYHEALRLLAGVPEAEEAPAVVRDWSEIVPGEALGALLSRLRSPENDPPLSEAELRASLRPYQRVGLRWLWTLDQLGLGGCLADDMGLGKTVQVIALLAKKKKLEGSARTLLVVPASLIANWRAEIDRFAPQLAVLVAHGSAMPRAELARLAPPIDADVVITTYGSLPGLPGLLGSEWGLVVLDEAQAIKNAETKAAQAAKQLRARSRLALTGTPIENRLSDLWSLFDFVCPGLLGGPKQFAGLVQRLGGSYGPLRELVRPYILRRKKTDPRVIDDLPEKIEVTAWCPLSKTQVALYEQSVAALESELEAVDGIQRRGVVLAFLMRLKQICNHPSQWLRDGGFDPKASGKLARLGEIAEEIAARQEKLLVFTQFREICAPLATYLEGVFGRPGLVLHGQTPVAKRKALVDAFQDELGPPFFVLSLKAGGTGLNLTAASHVVHFDRWWNPAVEDQATDRAFRIGQRRNVVVHKMVCRGTVEERIAATIEAKRGLARELIAEGAEAMMTELSDQELLDLVRLDAEKALARA